MLNSVNRNCLKYAVCSIMQLAVVPSESQLWVCGVYVVEHLFLALLYSAEATRWQDHGVKPSPSAFRQINACQSQQFWRQWWGEEAVGCGEWVRGLERSPDGWVQRQRRERNGDQAQSQRAQVIIAQTVWKMDRKIKSVDKNRKPHAL